MHDLATRSSFLLRLSNHEDVDAWAEFSDRYAGLIRGFLSRAGVNATDRDDIAQDAMLSLYRAMPKFRYDAKKGRFRAYLKTVVMRAAARHGQKSRRMHTSEAPPAVSADRLDEIWELEWRRHHVRRALALVTAEIPDGERLAFERYVVGGESALATAEQTGLSVDRVYRVRWKVMRRLSEIIESQVKEEE